jgi:hypothetical protein
MFTQAQEINKYSIGTWRDHFPYGNVIDLCVAPDGRIYCATPYGVFAFNPADNAVERINKSNGLSDVGLTAIESDPTSGAVVVGYQNGNIDLIFGNKVINLPDIRLSNQAGDKAIYDIYPYNGLLYLSTGFGVVVVDPQRLEVRSTYFLGVAGSAEKVNDLAVNNDTIYVASATGLKQARASDPFLANFQRWSAVAGTPGPTPEVKDIEFFMGFVFLCQPEASQDRIWKKNATGGTWESFAAFDGLRFNRLWNDGKWFACAGQGSYQVYHFDLGMNVNDVTHNGNIVNANMALVHREYGFFAADQKEGLLYRAFWGDRTIIRPNGPAEINARKLGVYNDNMWVAPGGAASFWGNLFNVKNIPAFVEDKWYTVQNDWITQENIPVIDFMSTAIDPMDNKRVYLGSWKDGLAEVYNRQIVALYTPDNSTLNTAGFEWSPNWTGVGGVAFDANGILWCTNTNTPRCIHSRDRNGTFTEYNFAPAITTADVIVDILPTRRNFVWAIVPSKGILAFNPNGTIGITTDDSFKLLTDADGFGALPSKDVLSMEEDLDGEIWVGTLQGLTVFYNQEAVFSEENYDAEQILITQDGNVQKLLESEAVTSIKIDGSNRKWIGTQNSGVYLFSDDGLREIFHFTADDSPLPSNTVYDIAINQRTGEVYFATEQGIMAFFSTATNFDQTMASIRAFPNPVEPDYDGNIVIDGLAYETVVKITDIQGNLIFETTSEGGRAVWNGRRLDGEKPASGVYLVFAASSDGEIDNVTTITIVR